MKYNITPEDCKFFVDEEARKIICIYDKSKTLFVDFACDNFPIATGLFFNHIKLYNECLMPNKFTGITVCSPDDQWDEDTGCLIAFSRMKDNLNRSFFKKANKYFNWLDERVNQDADLINKIGVKLANNEEHRHNYIKLKIGEKPDVVS